MDSKITTTMAAAAEPPTTYVQADPHTFRGLVQRLTGAPSPSKPSAAAVGPRRQAFKLHDRRGSSVRRLEVKLGLTSLKSPRSIISRSPTPSPVTPLVADPVFSPTQEEEERVIKEKGYYLHPSPRGTGTPELLTLFPLCSRSPKHQQQQAE